MNMKIFRLLTVCTIAGLCASCASVRHAPDAASVRFGVIQKHSDGTWSLVRETTTIPLRLRATGFAFGYVYRPGHENEYTIHDVSYMPAAPVTLTGEIGTYPVKSAVAGVTTPDYTMRGEHWMEYWFDEGDPLGDYRIDVVVDGRCVRSIRFTVVPDAEAPTTGGTVRR